MSDYDVNENGTLDAEDVQTMVDVSIDTETDLSIEQRVLFNFLHKSGAESYCRPYVIATGAVEALMGTEEIPYDQRVQLATPFINQVVALEEEMPQYEESIRALLESFASGEARMQLDDMSEEEQQLAVTEMLRATGTYLNPATYEEDLQAMKDQLMEIRQGNIAAYEELAAAYPNGVDLSEASFGELCPAYVQTQNVEIQVTGEPAPRTGRDI